VARGGLVEGEGVSADGRPCNSVRCRVALLVAALLLYDDGVFLLFLLPGGSRVGCQVDARRPLHRPPRRRRAFGSVAADAPHRRAARPPHRHPRRPDAARRSPTSAGNVDPPRRVPLAGDHGRGRPPRRGPHRRIGALPHRRCAQAVPRGGARVVVAARRIRPRPRRHRRRRRPLGGHPPQRFQVCRAVVSSASCSCLSFASARAPVVAALFVCAVVRNQTRGAPLSHGGVSGLPPSSCEAPLPPTARPL